MDAAEKAARAVEAEAQAEAHTHTRIDALLVQLGEPPTGLAALADPLAAHSHEAIIALSYWIAGCAHRAGLIDALKTLAQDYAITMRDEPLARALGVKVDTRRSVSGPGTVTDWPHPTVSHDPGRIELTAREALRRMTEREAAQAERREP